MSRSTNFPTWHGTWKMSVMQCRLVQVTFVSKSTKIIVFFLSRQYLWNQCNSCLQQLRFVRKEVNLNVKSQFPYSHLLPFASYQHFSPAVSRSSQNINTPQPPGKPRAFYYFMCPGMGNWTFTWAGWGKLNRKCQVSGDFFFSAA